MGRSLASYRATLGFTCYLGADSELGGARPKSLTSCSVEIRFRKYDVHANVVSRHQGASALARWDRDGDSLDLRASLAQDMAGDRISVQG